MKLKPDTPYQKINIIIAGLILSVFIYSGVFSYRDRYPFSSQTEVLFQNETISSGLSRSFSAIIRGKFELARTYNRFGMQLFIFFIFQFFLRLVFYSISKKKIINETQIIFADAGISSGLFIVYFEPFIVETVFI